jgi:hypothetical protein
VVEDKTIDVTTGQRSGSAGWIVALVLVVALVIGVVFFSRLSTNQTAKDKAVVTVAHRTGNAAGRVGNAAEKAGNGARDAVPDENK